MNNVAFDLHSDNVFMRIEDETGKMLCAKRLENNILKIVEMAASFGEESRFVLESTGNWYWLVDGLREAGYTEVTLANALELHLISGSKVKTDPRDARALAKLLRLGEVPEAYAYPAGKREIRDLLRHRIILVELRTGCYLRLRSALGKYNFSNGLTTSGLKGVKEEELDRLPLPELVKFSCGQLVRMAKHLNEEIKALEAKLEPLADEEPTVRRLKEMPGVGIILGMTICYESGDVSRFPDYRKYCSYTRVMSGSNNSNRKVRGGNKSKQGNPYLKWAFMQAAICAARCDERIARIKQRYLETHQGKALNLRANNKVAHQLCIAAYQMMRKGVPFDEKRFFSGEEAAIPRSRMGLLSPGD